MDIVKECESESCLQVSAQLKSLCKFKCFTLCCCSSCKCSDHGLCVVCWCRWRLSELCGLDHNDDWLKVNEIAQLCDPHIINDCSVVSQLHSFLTKALTAIWTKISHNSLTDAGMWSAQNQMLQSLFFKTCFVVIMCSLDFRNRAASVPLHSDPILLFGCTQTLALCSSCCPAVHLIALHCTLPFQAPVPLEVSHYLPL